MRTDKWLKIVLALSAFVPFLSLLSPVFDPLLLIYTFFIFAYFFKAVAGKLFNRFSSNWNIRFSSLVLLAGLFTESLAWGNNYLARRDPPVLFHPQLIYDLLIGVAMYGAWAVAWGLLVKRYRYSVWQAFAIQGIYGVLLEQKGAVFVQGLLHMPAGLLMWLYVFAVYGSITGLAFVLAGGSDNQQPLKSGWTKFPLALVLLLILSFLFSVVWELLLRQLGLIPAPVPIWQRPFI